MKPIIEHWPIRDVVHCLKGFRIDYPGWKQKAASFQTDRTGPWSTRARQWTTRLHTAQGCAQPLRAAPGPRGAQVAHRLPAACCLRRDVPVGHALARYIIST